MVKRCSLPVLARPPPQAPPEPWRLQQGRQRSAAVRFWITTPHPLHLAQEARTMTGEFARLVVGAWMTAALSVSGFFSTPPAAHAGGGSSATCSVNRLR